MRLYTLYTKFYDANETLVKSKKLHILSKKNIKPINTDKFLTTPTYNKFYYIKITA